MITFGIVMSIDGPLRADWNMHLADFQRLLRAAAPKETGALGNSLTVSEWSYDPPITRIQSPLEYAFIQNFGGTIPARESPLGRPMQWLSPVYGWTKKMRVGPSVIRGSNYIERAANAWFKLISVKWVNDIG